jgi:uncharacterized protein (DUF427 family)
MANTEHPHYASINRFPRKLTLTHAGKVVAETTEALILKEVAHGKVYDPVYYIPKADIKLEMVMDPESKGRCPLKGKSYRWNLKNDPIGPYFGWSYEEPLEGVPEIKGHIAFNGAYVTFLSEPL